MTSEESRHKYDTGAERSADCDNVRYDLISPIAMESVARTYAEGAEKFGAYNWENGMPATDMLNHALRHIYKFLGGCRAENHLGHAIWNLMGAEHSLARWPELNKDFLRGPDCSAPACAAKQKPAEPVVVATTAPWFKGSTTINEPLTEKKNG